MLARDWWSDLTSLLMKAGLARCSSRSSQVVRRRNVAMAWTTPTLVEICIGLEINGYLPAEI
jgi:coenzyme PQQ precursor peptide PqqA